MKTKNKKIKKLGFMDIVQFGSDTFIYGDTGRPASKFDISRFRKRHAALLNQWDRLDGIERRRQAAWNRRWRKKAISFFGYEKDDYSIPENTEEIVQQLTRHLLEVRPDLVESSKEKMKKLFPRFASSAISEVEWRKKWHPVVIDFFYGKYDGFEMPKNAKELNRLLVEYLFYLHDDDGCVADRIKQNMVQTFHGIGDAAVKEYEKESEKLNE